MQSVAAANTLNLENLNESTKEPCDRNQITMVSEVEDDGTQPYILGMHN